MKQLSLHLFLALAFARISYATPVTFSITFDRSVRAEPATGRLVVYLFRDDVRSPMRSPADGFVESDPQPIYGIDVAQLAPGQAATVDDSATSFPVKLSELPAGKYRAEAVLDMAHENSSWQREPGNLFSNIVDFDTTQPLSAPVQIKLAQVVKESKPSTSPTNAAQFVTIRSKLLSDFRGRDVYLRAGIAPPVGWDRTRAYPAVYEVPGFGGDHMMAVFKASRRAHRARGSAAEEVARSMFWIFLDPEGPNGHTVFADSDVNGPCGQALIKELIPELEKRFNLIAQPSARIVTGHSSGGWSSLWLATEYPDTFGACWSSSPDPIDFRRFELVNIYDQANLYTDADGKEISSARFGGKSTMTTRQENGMEQSLGPRNDSAQQWDSWQACWGHKGENGWPKPMFDPISGAIDHVEAESYRRFDITDRLRKDPKRFVPIFRDNIRLVCGETDTYYLEEAVTLLKADLDKLDPRKPDDARPGYVKLAPGDHGTVMMSKEMQAWPSEMMAHLRKHGHAPPATQPATQELR